jgi:hypothetical protein
MASIREKALAQGVSEDEMLERNAIYTFEKNYPVYFKVNQGIMRCMKEIQQDPYLYDSLLRESSTYRFDETELLWIKASERYRQEEIGKVTAGIPGQL